MKKAFAIICCMCITVSLICLPLDSLAVQAVLVDGSLIVNGDFSQHGKNSRYLTGLSVIKGDEKLYEIVF